MGYARVSSGRYTRLAIGVTGRQKVTGERARITVLTGTRLPWPRCLPKRRARQRREGVLNRVWATPYPRLRHPETTVDIPATAQATNTRSAMLATDRQTERTCWYPICAGIPGSLPQSLTEQR